MRWAPRIGIAIGLGVGTLAGQPAAVLNKALAAHGHRTFATPAGMARALFGGSSLVDTAIAAVVAVAVGAATLTVLAGTWQTIRGDRGGVELTLSGVFGIVGVIAALSVVM